ncbi:MAG TPA: deoxyribose-phosphate aldolase [Verrucomicrobiae bacterium]|nr:deoxyribose-phosphate aldolase [Verrucomicrobiae bacterium]
MPHISFWRKKDHVAENLREIGFTAAEFRHNLSGMTDDIARRVERHFDKPFPTTAGIEELCQEAREHQYRAVVVPSSSVATAVALLEESGVKVSCIIGFPFGSNDPDVKRYETDVAIDNGTNEIELIPSLARLREGDYPSVLREIRDVVEAADERIVKVAIEASLWDDAELKDVVQIILDSGARFISTGSVTLGKLRKLREMIGSDFGIKASELQISGRFEEFVVAGADLLGVGEFSEFRTRP